MIRAFTGVTLLRRQAPVLLRAFGQDPMKERGSAAENEWARKENGRNARLTHRQTFEAS